MTNDLGVYSFQFSILDGTSSSSTYFIPTTTYRKVLCAVSTRGSSWDSSMRLENAANRTMNFLSKGEFASSPRNSSKYGRLGSRFCSSGLDGDTQFETCASLCRVEIASGQCRFCKCRACPHCSGVLRSNREKGAHTPCKSAIAGDWQCAPIERIRDPRAHLIFARCCVTASLFAQTAVVRPSVALQRLKHIVRAATDHHATCVHAATCLLTCCR